jgi:hypothetical protein
MNEMKAVLKVSSQAGKSGTVNKTSVESTAQDDDFREVKRQISNDTSQTAKKSTKPIPTFAAVKLPPKAVLARNFSAPLRATDMDTVTTGAEDPQKTRYAATNNDDFYHKPHSTPKKIQTTMSKESTSSEIHEMEPVS